MGIELKRFRRRRGLTQEQLADLSGVGQTAISRLERTAGANPHWETVDKLARALRARPDDLFPHDDLEAAP